MHPDQAPPRDGDGLATLAMCVVVALLAMVLWNGFTDGPEPELGRPLQALGLPQPATAMAATTAAPAVEPLRPARISVPAIDVDAPVIELGLNRDQSLQVPEDFSVTGWWSGGTPPGGAGPAVIVGHYDSDSGGAVFAELHRVRAGDEIVVSDAGGRSLGYVVQRVEQHPKDAFPTAAVYGPTAQPTLRLVTCGGSFNRRARSYRDNVVVFAGLAPGEDATTEH